MPTVRLIVLDEEFSKYKPEDSAITVDVLSKFVEDFKSGKLSVSKLFPLSSTSHSLAAPITAQLIKRLFPLVERN